VGPNIDRYYLDPDVHEKCENLRSNQPLFLVSRCTIRPIKALCSTIGSNKLRYLNQYKIFECLLTGTLN